MSITIHDVSHLLELPIHGKLMSHRVRMSKDDDVALLNELLGIDIEVTYDECKAIN
jgi:hypothetical protein